jgi:pimeloyl-ACP methyl ester carboxylesterase
MVAIPVLPGVVEKTIATKRITTRVLFAGPDSGTPILFLHGNVTSATWWEEVMLSLPAGFRGIAPDQRGFGAADPGHKIDATRGMGDLVDDALALLDHLAIDRVDVVGNSIGGSVVWRLIMAAPERLHTVTLVNPGSPFGFGGTKDDRGTPCFDDFAGSGGGLTNPELLRLIEAGDASLDHPFSPRAALRMLVYKPPFVPAREDDLVAATLQTHIGPEDLPGDSVASPNWPHVAPGRWGIANAASPKYAGAIDALYAIETKPPVLWVRGSDDLAVSDTAASCPGALGAAGRIPDWPGAAVFPPQPMLGQTRAVLERYQAAGGAYREVVIADTGHVPFLENLPEFNRAFHAYLTTPSR